MEAQGKAEARHSGAPLHLELDGQEIWPAECGAFILKGDQERYWVIRRTNP